MIGRSLLAGSFLLCSLTMPTMAQVADLDRLKQAIEERQKQEKAYKEKAGTLKREVSDLQQKMISLASDLQAGEVEASKTEEKIYALSLQEKKLVIETDAERGRQSETLSALMRISREPPTSLAMRYDHPVDAARAAMLMGAALPALEERAQNLGDELAALREVREELQVEKSRLTETLGTIEKDRLDLEKLVGIKREAQLAALDLADRMKEERLALAKNAKNVASLLEKLEKQAAQERSVLPKAKPSTSDIAEQTAALSPQLQISSVKGDLLLPVRGRLISRFGEDDNAGGHTKGITLQSRSRAAVVAPHGGEVLFSGPFKGYGQVLIISAGEGYHILLAGLARIDSVPGQFLLRGEPVGQMGSSDRTARLYIEIREQGTPVNPALWLAMNQGKARG